jgi:hypothetical protein
MRFSKPHFQPEGDEMSDKSYRGPDVPFKPGIHVNYQESVLRIRDGLPKMKDMPKEMGGSGATLPE